MTKTLFSHSFRMLICGNCGAPLEVPTEGGHVTCSYCRVASQYSGRDERADLEAVRAKQPLNEAARYQRLREQDGKPLMPPPALVRYMVNGALAPQLAPQAMAEWQQTRIEVQRGAPFGTHERLHFLTLFLYGHMSRQNEEQRCRAMLETALEVLTSARHKQELRGMLARRAARSGDFHAADEWLAPCDPYSDDLHMDTAYRFSKAYVCTARRDYQSVLQLLGPRIDDVPIADGSDLVCGVLRANAHEQTGQLATAVQQLLTFAQANGSLARHEGIVQANAHMMLCSQSMAQARAQLATQPARRAAGSGRSPVRMLFALPFTLLPIGFIIAGFLVPEGSTTDDGHPLNYFFFFMGACFLIGPAILFIIGIVKKRRADHFAKVGVPGTGQILSVSETGLRVNNQPQVAIVMRVFVGNHQPYEITHKKVVSVVDLSRLQPGTSLPLKVDPNKMTDVMLG